MKRLIAASVAALVLGGAAWANCQTCMQQCQTWYPDDPNLQAACMNGCAYACLPE